MTEDRALSPSRLALAISLADYLPEGESDYDDAHNRSEMMDQIGR